MTPLNYQDIAALLPHRYPFLLVDRVEEIDLEEKMISCYKNVSANEEFFNGHFPGNPIMPGVLQIEAMAQAGVILAMKSGVADPEKDLLVFTGINKAKFRGQVVPGDRLDMKVRVTGQRRNIFMMEGKAYVGDKVVVECELQAAAVAQK
jgi:3-hydroxyacyl-[acyl-carrier-protein] dehydratase